MDGKESILIVDDDEGARRSLRLIFEEKGYATVLAATGAEALAKARGRFFNVALLDIRLPDIEGVDLVGSLKEMHPDMVVIMSTAHATVENTVRALNEGASAYVTKPLNMDSVLATITGAIEKQQLVMENRRLYVLSQRELAERRQADAKLKETLVKLEKSHDDILAILDQFRMPIAMTDQEGRITFLSRAGQQYLRLSRKGLVGKRWEQMFPFCAEEIAALKAMCEEPSSMRSRVPVHTEMTGGRHYWFEVEVHDDPREKKRKIFYLYDTTEAYDLRMELGHHAEFHDLIGQSEAMQQVFRQIREVAEVDWTVLIQGETGSGKELVAQALHRSSHRREKPFVAVNCAGLLEALLASQLFGHRRGSFTGAIEDHKGVFEAANGGTLFLDEIGDIPQAIQPNLLRAIEMKEITRLGETRTRKVDVRLIAATHRDLNRMEKDGSFRADLLYRIRVARIRIPPLREHRGDIPLLVSKFLSACCAATAKNVREVSSEAMRILFDYRWPGNVRELQSAVEFAVIHAQGPVIKADDLPPELAGAPDPVKISGGAPMDERQEILDALRKVGGHRGRAAQLLGMGRATLYRRMAAMGLGSKY